MIDLEVIKQEDRHVFSYAVGGTRENPTAGGNSISLPRHDKPIYTLFHDGRLVRHATRWLRTLANDPRTSPETVYQYARALKALFEYMEAQTQFGGLAMDNIIQCMRRKDLQDWVMNMKAHLAPTTVRNREAIAKSFIDWLCTDEGGNVRTMKDTPYPVTHAHPDGRLISPAPARSKHRPIPINEVLIPILKGFHNESERCAGQFIYDTGARISELRRARKGDLPDESRFPPGLKYYPMLLRGAKGAGGQEKHRFVMLSAPVLARIRRYHKSAEYRFSPYFDDRDPNKPLFLGVNGQPISQRNFLKQLKSAIARSGQDPKDFWTHLLRHGNAFSILMSDMGKDYFDNLFLAMMNLGHERIETTQVYTRIPPAFLQALSGQRKAIDRREEAKTILDATFLAPGQHKEHRGHRNDDD